MSWGDGMERTISEAIAELVGDTPVAEQLNMALNYVAPKEHKHDNYADKNEVELLKKQVELLLELVGDVSVSEQIKTALSRQGG